jgi:uncharacterized membrane protein YeaQ/YmgE (transglycosylase-associated protein family)
MDLQGLILFLAIGAVLGCLRGLIFRGGGFSLIGNSFVGIIGAVVGGLGCSMFGFGFTGSEIIGATAGAVILLWTLRL